MLLFEAFKSRSISKTIAFLKKESSIDAVDEFIQNLKRSCDDFDIPIDKISDDDIKYFSKKDGLKIRSSEDVHNEFGVYCVKYWFSIEDGFVTKTGAGNLLRQKERENLINTDLLEELNINTGIVKAINNYREIGTGDKVVCKARGLSILATVWRYGSDVFLIQDEVDDNYERPRGDWDIYGTKSWTIHAYHEVMDNHTNLCKWTDNGEELALIGEIETNVLDTKLFNLNIIDGKLKTNYDMSTRISTSDFCLVLYIDDILKRELPSTSKKRQYRSDSRVGAIALLSDEQMRDINLLNYISTISKTIINLRDDSVEIGNINKLTSNILKKDYSFFIIRNKNIDPKISAVFSSVKELVRISEYYKNQKDSNINGKEEALSKLYNDVISKIKLAYNFYEDNYKDAKSNYIIIKERCAEIEEGEEILKQLERIMGISNQINSYIYSKNTDSLIDIKIALSKVNSIRNTISDEDFDMPYYFNSLLNHMTSTGTYIRNTLDNIISDKEIKEITKAIDNIQRYIDSITGK